jgi:hypothetical protein
MATTGLPMADEIERAHKRLVGALAASLALADRGGPDFAGCLAAALQDLARRHGSAERLVESRPGSWEASHVRALGAIEADWGF